MVVRPEAAARQAQPEVDGAQPPADPRTALRHGEREPFQRIVKSTFQPSDYFADSAGFAANLNKDIADKKRLLTALGMVKN